MEVVWLGQEMCHDASRVGGKAANLSRLAASHRIPPGFCLTTTAFDQWMADRPPAVPITKGDNRRSALHEAVATAYQEMALRCGVAAPAVAVRSSAIDEDGGSASFAGQHDTYLNITGAGAVAEAVVRCWGSLRTERAIEYRRQHGLSIEGTRLAVLIQQLVPADVSGVAFSANPVTNDRDQVVITTSWGLGESIVGGTVTPDTYVVRKADLKIIGRQVADKLRMTVAVPGGTSEVDVPRLLRTQPTLDDAQAAEVARLVIALEATMGWPVDIECAYRARELHLLQCRPITTLDR